MKNKYIFLFIAALLMSLTACDNEDYKLYDTNQQDAVYIEYAQTVDEAQVLVDTVDYEFGYDIATEHKVVIPVKLMGMPADHDRAFNVKAISDSLDTTDMVEGTHYTIDTDSLIIPANKVEGKIIVTLLRNNDEMLQWKQYTLKLQLQETEDLRPVGQTTFRIRYDDIRPMVAPAWWVSYTFPTYSFEIAQKFFYYFYQSKEQNPQVFDAMIQRYGEYFVNAVAMQGPTAMYSNFVTKYALIPLYEETKNDPSIVWPSVPALH